MDYGILSIIPAVLAIVLAMITKNIVISLAISVFVGSTIICGWNPIAGFLEAEPELLQIWLLRKLTPDQNAKAVSGWADCSYGSPPPETL